MWYILILLAIGAYFAGKESEAERIEEERSNEKELKELSEQQFLDDLRSGKSRETNP